MTEVRLAIRVLVILKHTATLLPTTLLPAATRAAQTIAATPGEMLPGAEIKMKTTNGLPRFF